MTGNSKVIELDAYRKPESDESELAAFARASAQEFLDPQAWADFPEENGTYMGKLSEKGTFVSDTEEIEDEDQHSPGA